MSKLELSQDRVSLINELKKLAEKVFDGNLIDLGISGSFVDTTTRFQNKDFDDIDSILVIRKFNAETIKQFMKEAKELVGKKVSVVVLTPLMSTPEKWSDKLLTMIAKGVKWQFESEFSRGMELDREQLRTYTLKLLPESINRLDKALLKGKIDLPQYSELVRQLITIVM